MGELARGSSADARWDLTALTDLDTAGATLLWTSWKQRRPADLRLRPEDERIFELLAAVPIEPPAPAVAIDVTSSLARIGSRTGTLALQTLGLLDLLGQVVLIAARLTRYPARIPLKEISAAVFRNGTQALPITALVGFLIGVVLSYLSAQQLHALGADTLVINLTGFTILRELGPLLAAILNVGRSGSAMTAELGVMRITNELDAMTVLGISPVLRLLLPRIVGQMIALPLVVLWTDGLAILGAMLGAKLQLGISFGTFLHRLPQVVPVVSFWFGVCKGVLFGALIGLIACDFGLRARPDTQGLAAATTRSVVAALTSVLLADALLAIAFANVGLGS